MNHICEAMNKHLLPTDRILDIGCGNGTWSPVGCLHFREVVGLDAFQPYLDEYKAVVRDSEIIQVNLANITCEQLEEIVPDFYNFDAVISIDFVEHLEPEQSRNFIEMMEKIPKRSLLIFTPENAQDPDLPTLNEPEDTWGIKGGDDFQKHRSAQNRKYYAERGYSVSHLAEAPNVYDRTIYYEMLYVKTFERRREIYNWLKEKK